MRIDRTHRPWAAGTFVAFLAALIVYVAQYRSANTRRTPCGGTAIGLAFGIAGYTLMLFEGLLGARKKVPVWRLGSAHKHGCAGISWLGLLTVPLLIIFHSGFAYRGTLTAVLKLVLLVIVVAKRDSGRAFATLSAARRITARVYRWKPSTKRFPTCARSFRDDGRGTVGDESMLRR